jgi:hypothetical protein
MRTAAIDVLRKVLVDVGGVVRARFCEMLFVHAEFLHQARPAVSAPKMVMIPHAFMAPISPSGKTVECECRAGEPASAPTFVGQHCPRTVTQSPICRRIHRIAGALSRDTRLVPGGATGHGRPSVLASFVRMNQTFGVHRYVSQPPFWAHGFTREEPVSSGSPLLGSRRNELQ